jgi:hypothetical protein
MVCLLKLGYFFYFMPYFKSGSPPGLHFENAIQNSRNHIITGIYHVVGARTRIKLAIFLLSSEFKSLALAKHSDTFFSTAPYSRSSIEIFHRAVFFDNFKTEMLGCQSKLVQLIMPLKTIQILVESLLYFF